jgi:NAD(P)H dehydrogenase (quinone)
MTKVLVVYYSMYGHVAELARAVADGAREVAGAEVTVKRVADLISDERLKEIGAYDNPDPVASPNELADYDAIIFGTPTRFGNMAAQMRNFLDQTGGLWANRKLVGKVGAVFVSTGGQHGGHETTATSFHTTLMHHGMVIVGVPYACEGLSAVDEISGGSPYAAGTIANRPGDGLSDNEIAIARYQGRHVAETARALVEGRKVAA